MDSTLKQRILGIIVLFAILGICLSVLLHHNKNSQRSKMPAITKTALTPPPIVNTTSALLNSNNSANMTPANTNVFDNDIPAPSNTATPTNTPAAPTQTASASQVQPQLQQQLQTATAQPTAATPQASTQSSAAFNEASPQSPSQPIVNNQASPSTVATSAIKPIAPPSSTPTQDVTAQITAANATSTPNTDDAYPSQPNNTVSSSATAVPTNTNSIAAHKATPHAHAKATKAAAIHKKTTMPAQHAAIVNVTPHAAVSSTQEAETGFVVQVGSFNLPANAETLADKLRAKGFATSIQKYHTGQGDMTRVVVGKNGLDHTQVETLRHQLQTQMQINGFVVPQNTSSHIVATSSTLHSNAQTNKHINVNPSNTNANDEI